MAGFEFTKYVTYEDNGNIIAIRGLNCKNGSLDLRDVKYIDNSDFSKLSRSKLYTGDILYTYVGTVGEVAVVDKNDKYYLAPNVSRIRLSKDYNSDFIKQLLGSKKFYNQIVFPLIATSSQPALSMENLRKFKLKVPSIREQTKIASLLNAIDERIATQNKIIDKLQSLIKGIMVELQKQGVDKGTWKKVFLSDVLTERNERNTNLFQVFSVSVSQGVVNQVDYLGRSFAAKDTSKYNVVHYGDLVYTKSPTGSFPYGIVKQSLNLENVAVSPLYGVYKPKSLAVGAYLHEYFMSEINTHNYLHPLIQKGAKNTINITNQRFLENCVLLPTNINELLQISKLLRSLNNKIKYQQDILQQYQKQKQYLLRQMFI